MHQHFHKNLNVKNILSRYKPSTIVELGGLNGANTLQLLTMGKVITISDNKMPDKLSPFVKKGELKWIQALSFNALKSFADGSIEFASVDTDHNYTTLKLELIELKRAMKKDGVVVLHDVETFKNRNNQHYTLEYANGEPYNFALMTQGHSYTAALTEEIQEGEWKLLDWSEASNGAAAIIKT
ncbi:MAG TPA: class I SAM-dependent methyltransferase [Flavobacteriales bacterium]|nr:class I SAM-dependent methyltransferase [Flavobacteriales bacterium]